MGEYASFRGQCVKIGTCEDMYYLRADQRDLVIAQPGNVRPGSAEDQKTIRFRFPWPDEDGNAPGAFEDHDRSFPVPGVRPPAGVDHYSIQFSAREGYLLSLPCPEGPPASHGLTIHRNAFQGPVRIVQQAFRNGHLALVCSCVCGARWNYPTVAAAEPIIVALRAKGDRSPNDARRFHEIADRIAAGYTTAGHLTRV